MNAGSTGREAHQNDRSNPNATLIYSNTRDDPKAHTHIPSDTRRRTCTIMAGPMPNGPRSQARASSGPCPASSNTLRLEEDPRPSRAEAGKSLRLPRFQDLPKISTSGLNPRYFKYPG